MVTSVKLEAVADEPEQVKAYFMACLARLNLGLGDVPDGGEVYERTASGGYRGRLKVVYAVPMNAAMEESWFHGTEIVFSADVQGPVLRSAAETGQIIRAEFLLDPLPTPDEVFEQVRERPEVVELTIRPVDGNPQRWEATLVTHSEQRPRRIGGSSLIELAQNLLDTLGADGRLVRREGVTGNLAWVERASGRETPLQRPSDLTEARLVELVEAAAEHGFVWRTLLVSNPGLMNVARRIIDAPGQIMEGMVAIRQSDVLATEGPGEGSWKLAEAIVEP